MLDASASPPTVQEAVIYARVSSKDQEKEGYSIPAQLDLLRAYAGAKGLTVTQEFIDVETPKGAGRTSFGRMVAFLKKHINCSMILVEKTDRLYRNFRDYVTIDELGAEIHLVKENVVLSPQSRSSEKFMHGIKVLMAKNYIDNLSEESRKGMREKARQGMWPSYAPLGYRNVSGTDGKWCIDPDPDLAPIILQMYEMYATGTHSLKDVAKVAHENGLAYRKNRNRVPTSTVHKILRNRIYTGDFDFEGVRYHGRYTPIVPLDLWEKVQGILDGRATSKTRTKTFAFNGLLKCGHCGCAIVGELKKGRYVYYRCTGNKGPCPERYTREEALEKKFTALLTQLVFSDKWLDWAQNVVNKESSADRYRRESTISRLRSEFKRLEHRIDAMYLDKLDGKIEPAFYERKAAEWRSQQAEISQQIAKQEAETAHAEIDVQQLSARAVELFALQPAEEKRKLLDFLITGCGWRSGELLPQWRMPWTSILRDLNCAA
jgi:DNA invertase Pin-like site-specific DNA recombinase